MTASAQEIAVPHHTAGETAHIPALDGIRGIAILLVMLCHAGAILKDTAVGRYVGYGWLGVDLFFVLSGFLITGILTGTKDSPTYYRRFYIRRGLRIWPLYYLFLLVNVIGFYLIAHNPAIRHVTQASEFLRNSPPRNVTPLPYYLLFLQNLYLPSYFSAKDWLAITWSLCIEEHFYLVWPILVRHITRRRLIAGLILLLALEPLLRLAAAATLAHSNYQLFHDAITRVSLFHLDSIAAGSLLALLWSRLKEPRRHTRTFALMAFGGLAATAALIPFEDANAYLFSFCFSAIACMGTGVVALGLLGWQRRLLTSRPLRYCGKISYGLYLIHPTIFGLSQSRTLYAKLGLGGHLQLTEFVATAVAFTLSLLLATLSWRIYESPILRLKARFT